MFTRAVQSCKLVGSVIQTPGSKHSERIDWLIAAIHFIVTPFRLFPAYDVLSFYTNCQPFVGRVKILLFTGKLLILLLKGQDLFVVEKLIRKCQKTGNYSSIISTKILWSWEDLKSNLPTGVSSVLWKKTSPLYYETVPTPPSGHRRFTLWKKYPKQNNLITLNKT